jgi:hypothetical protein
MKIIACHFLMLASTVFPVSAESIKSTSSSEVDKAELVKKSQHIVCPQDGCTQDNDFYTVQIILAKDGDNTPSHVSDDGQVIFLNSAYKVDAKALIEQSLERRLAHGPGT